MTAISNKLRTISISAVTIFTVGLLLTLPTAHSPADAAQSQASCTVAPARWDRAGTHKIYVPATSSGSRNCLLGQGNQSQAVGVLQLALNGPTSGGCYGRSISADGIFGPLTKTALKWVQQNKLGMTGSQIDGIYGVNTHNKIKFSDNPYGIHCYQDGAI
jgi:peptidoglycan hydrolase-like protein with peptidoglycan-binding domain